MFINKLSGNKTMKSIIFDNSCINLILGSKTDNNSNKTVNGVGKTLSLNLMDFCLGNTIPESLKKLEGWEFNLDITIDNYKYNINRTINDHNNIFLNSQKKTKKEFLEYMYNTNFNVLNNITELSFRSLISRFIRVPPHGYTEWEKGKEKEEKDISLLLNAYLLDIDVNQVYKKITLKNNIEKLKKSKSTFENDIDLKNILKGTDIGINKISLIKDIENINEKLTNFKISEEYNNIKLENESLKTRKNVILNNISSCNNILDNIDKSLEISIDISADKVIKLYNEANVIFPQSVVKNIDEVNSFHLKLLETRKNRLEIDKKKYFKTIRLLNEELEIINNKLNDNLKILNETGPLSDFQTLQNELYEKNIRLEKVSKYDELITSLEFKIKEIGGEIVIDNKQAFQYLEYIRPYRENLMSIFKEYIDYIYNERKPSGIAIKVNDRFNKLQFNIEPEVAGENSEGIRNVKTFCMDLLFLTLQKNHKIKFIYHDSSIFNGIDPRQVNKMLQLIKMICEKNNFQYIVNMNYNLFEDVLELSKDDNFDKYLKDHVVIRLYDKNPENKLLGIDF